MYLSKMWPRATIEELSSITCVILPKRKHTFFLLPFSASGEHCGRTHKTHVISCLLPSFTSETSQHIPPLD